MARKSGFCGTGTHERCMFITVNGIRATQRYSPCSCVCHDGQQASLDTITATLPKFPDIPFPLDASRDEMSRYLDTVNAVMRPSPDADTETFSWSPPGEDTEDTEG